MTTKIQSRLNSHRQTRIKHEQEGRRLDLERDELIAEAREAGLTLQEIADALQLTKGRVAQLAKGTTGTKVPRSAYVLRTDRGTWIVETKNSEDGSSHRSEPVGTQTAALKQATQYLKALGGGEIVVHGTNGMIRERLTVRPTLENR